MTGLTMPAGTPATEFPACRMQGQQSVSIIHGSCPSLLSRIMHAAASS